MLGIELIPTLAATEDVFGNYFRERCVDLGE